MILIIGKTSFKNKTYIFPDSITTNLHSRVNTHSYNSTNIYYRSPFINQNIILRFSTISLAKIQLG